MENARFERIEYRIEVTEGFLRQTIKRLKKKAGEVVMLFPRPDGKVLLSTKEFYLNGTYRLPTGSIEKGESPDDALTREVYEEAGFRLTDGRKIGEIHWVFTHGEECAEYYSHVYLLPETTEEPVAMDRKERISGYREIPMCDLGKVGVSLMSLPARWHDWGRFRGMVHSFAQDLLCENKFRATDIETGSGPIS